MNTTDLTHDLTRQRELIRTGRPSAESALESSLAAARGPAAAAFVRMDPDRALQAARRADALQAAGQDPGALAGLAVSVKDLFDVEGEVTTAGSVVLADRPPARSDATAVARLRAAGAALVGRTQMTEFAFSGVGINPHQGTPANAAMLALGDPVPRVPGGSSSGAAVSVATGAAWAALGTDTGGSIRIPAALHGLVGFKNSQHLTPNEGSVPLAPCMDTSCAITRSVRDAIVLHEVLAARKVRPAGRSLSAMTFGVVRNVMLDQLDPTVARQFERSLLQLGSLGARVEHFDLPALADLPALTQDGGLTAAESWAWHRDLLASRGDRYDPRVATRIRRGAALSAETIELLRRRRRDWIRKMESSLQHVDFVLSPTVPMIAPPLEPLIRDDDAFFRVNMLLLRNTAIVNLLDGCAISLPCHAAGEAPVGLMLWSTCGRDDALLGCALAVERALTPMRAGL